MRFGWIGFHREGMPALEAVLASGTRVAGVITLKPDLAARRSGSEDYASLCRGFGVPLYHVSNINDREALEVLASLSLDVAFVIGWSQIVGPTARGLARTGMIGAHASLLPHNRGRAPINWALIRGEEMTGNTLFWLADSVDAGDLIDQTTIPITRYDTCESLYARVADSNRDMILRLIPRLLAGERPGRPQQDPHEQPLPGRRPGDGKIDWSKSSTEVYDFIRALTRPYPGAFSWLDGQRWFIWQSGLLPSGPQDDKVGGAVLGPSRSPIEGACGQVVACGSGTVILLEVEDEKGEILRGRALSDQAWTGKIWRSSPG